MIADNLHKIEGFHHSKTLLINPLWEEEKSVVYQILFALYNESTGILSHMCSVNTKVLR